MCRGIRNASIVALSVVMGDEGLEPPTSRM
jgi:hypothetical protein